MCIITFIMTRIPLLFTTFLLTLSLANDSRAASNLIAWDTVAPLPVGRKEGGGGVVDGKLYVFGGYANTSYQPTARVDAFDPGTNTWSQVSSMPKPVTHAGFAIDGNDFYIAGGYASNGAAGQIYGVRDVWRFNTVTKAWTALTPLPEARGSGGLVLLGRDLHFFSGGDLTRADRSDHWIYNLDTGTNWVPSAPLPLGRTHFGSIVLGGKIYALCGEQKSDANRITQNLVNVWDPANPGTWTNAQNYPRKVSHMGASTCLLDGRIIVYGGILDPQNNQLAEGWAYDPIGNTWTALSPLPTPRESGVAGVVNGKLYYAGGGSDFSSVTYRGSSSSNTANHFETEFLLVQAKSAATHRIFNDPAFSNGAATILDATAALEFVTYLIPVSAPGTYNLKIRIKTRSNRGIFQLSIDGVNQGTPQDEFTASESFVTRDLGTVMFPTGGDRLFKFLVTGRNASSAGYTICFDSIDLIPQSAPPPLLYEAETLPVAGTSGDVLRLLPESQSSGGSSSMFDSNAIEDFVAYNVNIPEARTYSVKIGVKKYFTRASFQFSADGIDFGAAQDLYAPSSVWTELPIGNVTFTATNNHAFKFRVVGRNASSSGYTLNIDYIKLVPQ
jgi:N-acetylneuraminic acid mutarotase